MSFQISKRYYQKIESNRIESHFFSKFGHRPKTRFSTFKNKKLRAHQWGCNQKLTDHEWPIGIELLFLLFVNFKLSKNQHDVQKGVSLILTHFN